MYPDFDPDVWEAPDGWLDAGTVHVGHRTLRVIPTPGHTRGHVVYLDEADRLLFAGDHVLPHITPSIGFELGPPPLPLLDYLGSLHLVAGFADARLLPAHGPVAASTHARIAELLAHHETRLVHTLRALGDRTLDGYAVARQLAWTRRAVAFADLDEMNQMLAVNETVAHLDVLVARGLVAYTVDGEVNRYRAV